MEKFENFNELILALMLWITSNTNYINPKQTPNIEFIEQSKLSELACGNRNAKLWHIPLMYQNIKFILLKI